MTTGGWIAMLASVGAVTLLLSWCIWKVVTTPGESDKLHAQVDLHSPDTDK